MLTIWQFLRRVWDVWIPHRQYPGPVRVHTRNDNKIADEWLEEHKGMTPEAFEEYRRRLLESLGEK